MTDNETETRIIMLAPSAIVVEKAWNSRQEPTSPKNQQERNENPDVEWPDDMLESSIREKGLLHPVRVRLAQKGHKGTGDLYALVFGFRRLAMCLKIDAQKPIPCSIMPSEGDEQQDDLKARLENLSENVNRKNLLPYELAEYCYTIKNVHSTPVNVIAAKAGLQEDYVRNLIRLRSKLCPELWEAWKKNPDGFSKNDLLEVCVKPKNEQVEAYNATLADKRGGRPKGSRTKRLVDLSRVAQWKKEVAKVKTSDPKRAAFLRGVKYALSASLGAPWDLKSAIKGV